MRKKSLHICCTVCLCSAFFLLHPTPAYAEIESAIGVELSTVLVAKINSERVPVYSRADKGRYPMASVTRGGTYEVLEDMNNGWVKIDLGNKEGYIPASGNATIFETTREKVDQSVMTRKAIVNYALQFVGGRYLYGGMDPNKGADCSGFTKYVMRNMLGVNLVHSSAGQSRQGTPIDLSNIKAGDLIFYSSGGRIDHVALYIGNGQVVHASTEKTGIKISELNHRKPVKAVSLVSN